ncbi:MAG: PaaI family thioesterase [Burkholderiaceae bacterium]
MNSEIAGRQDMDALISANAELMQSIGGVTLVEFNPDNRQIALGFECLPNFCHSGGQIAQGGFVTAWMDSAMAHAVILCNNRQFNVASLDINVRFMRPVGPGKVVAHGRIVRQGRRVVFLEGQLFDDSGECVATASSSGMLVPMSV